MFCQLAYIPETLHHAGILLASKQVGLICDEHFISILHTYMWTTLN